MFKNPHFILLLFVLSADAPIVSLSLGSNLDPKNLAKGTDVYLECRIEANPSIKKIEWYHNNKVLQPTRGVIITNQSLVLQSITKQTHGQYMCRASNTQGSVSSNDLYLDIKCKCYGGEEHVLGREITLPPHTSLFFSFSPLLYHKKCQHLCATLQPHKT